MARSLNPWGTHVPPTDFEAVLDRSGLTRKEAAKRLHRTTSRVCELVRTKGGSELSFRHFKRTLGVK